MRWYQGSIAEAVAASKASQAIFVVFVEGKDDSSLNIGAVIEDSTISSQLEGEQFVAIKLDSGSESYRQFAQIYQLVPVPSIFFIGTNGIPLEVVVGNVSVADLHKRISTVLEKCSRATAAPQVPVNQHSDVETGVPSLESKLPSDDSSKGAAAASTTKEGEGASPVTGSSNVRTVEQRVEHAKELIEKKRQQKREEEECRERDRELERRRMGQEVQKLQRWQQEQEVRELREQRKKEKQEEQAARQRVLQQISQDRAERAARFAPDQPKEPEVKKVPNSPVDQQSPPQGDIARIQFRMPDGSTHTQQFGASTLLSELRAYVASNLQLPFRDFALSTTFPRREFTASDNNLTVRDLQLIPTAVILILPATSTTVVSSPGYFDSFNRMFWSLLAPVAALVTYIRNLIFNRGGNPTTHNAVNKKRAESSTGETTTSNEKPQPVRRRNVPADTVTIQRQGNVHRLTNRRDSSEDENNTWNGNSTQQM